MRSHTIKIEYDVFKNFWAQSKIQLLFTSVMFVPIFFLKAKSELELLAFYFIYAQLMQIGPLILLPAMNVLYPDLTRAYKNKEKFLALSILIITIVSFIYLFLFFNLEFIVSLWVEIRLLLIIM